MRRATFTTIIGIVLSLGGMLWTGNQAWASQIAFVSFDGPNPEICVMNSDGTNIQNLTNNPVVGNNWPTWSPDGKRIAFVTHVPSNLYLMDPDGGNVTLLKENYPWSSRPAWSPDGQKIAFGRTFFIFILDLNTQEEKELFIPEDNEDSGFRDLAWSPNGRLIAFTIRRNRQRDIYVINADGTQLRQLTKHPAEDHAPAWSPDGQKISFHSDRDIKAGIWLMDADGANLKRLTERNEDYPSWSPTGSHIAFSRSGDPPRVGVMKANGRNVKLLARGSQPSWQPASLAVNPIGKLFSIWGLVKLDF